MRSLNLRLAAIFTYVVVTSSSIGTADILMAQSSSRAERLVAEATITPSVAGDKIFLPVTIHGYHGTLILDVGTNAYLYVRAALADSLTLSENTVPQGTIGQGGGNETGPALLIDSLTIGHVVEHQVPYNTPDFNWDPVPSEFPPLVGLVGTKLLWHYDLLLDGSARRVRLYQPQARPSAHATAHRTPWLPPGISASDCTPLTIVRDSDDHFVSFALTVNGHAIPGFFDSGNMVTAMNSAAAAIAGIHESDPGTHLIPSDSVAVYASIGPQRVYSVTKVTLKLGPHILSDHRVYVYEQIPSPDPTAPEIDIGLDGFHDRLLWISYSSNQVCVSAPLPTH